MISNKFTIFKCMFFALLLLAGGIVHASSIEIIKDGKAVAILDIQNGETVNIRSDRVEFKNDSRLVYYFGNVVAKIGSGQAQLTLKSDEMVILPDGDSDHRTQNGDVPK